MPNFVPRLNVQQIYDLFNEPVVAFDCGLKCAPHNLNGKPFCCDICYAVPAAYHQEWAYLQANTDLWHAWRGDECRANPEDPHRLLDGIPDHMLLLACEGPVHCQREYRAVSCRQFPFFPYITSKQRFIGLAYEWEFEEDCWVISHLGAVTGAYHREFIHLYDSLFAHWPDEFEGYALKSEEMRLHYQELQRRIPILHRNGAGYLLSPGSERLRRVPLERMPRFGPYRQDD